MQPAQLPKDATEHFGNSLEPFIAALSKSDGTKAFDRQILDLPPEM